MKKMHRLLSLVLAVMMCLSLAACMGSQQEQDSLVYLDYGTGIDPYTDKYNTELYGFNGNAVDGPDPGCFYVSEEEDPEWGGYFYMYPTSFATNDWAQLYKYKEQGITNLVASCYRSKDLYNWELCGALEGGYSCVVDQEDWCQNYWWAPEVIRNPKDGKYYMYFNAMMPQGYNTSAVVDTGYNWARMFLGVAVSDTPVGPFDILYDIDPATGVRIPTINFHTGCKTEDNWSTIDANPFFDEDGTLYLYFNKHTDDSYGNLNGIWGVKMKSMTKPDYSTVSCVTLAGAQSVTMTPGQIETVEKGPATAFEGLNEGPTMVKHNGKYFMLFSNFGYTSPAYGVYAAVSDNPLTGFEKLDPADGYTVMDGAVHNHVLGTGHCAVAKKGDQHYIIYHRHASKYSWTDGAGRCIGADKLIFTENEAGLEIPQANGPSKNLVWLEEDISGYKNLMETAKVNVSSGSGVEYLRDGIMPYYVVTKDLAFTASEEEVTITLSWDEAVSVNSVMIFNSRDTFTAFSKVADIRFKLAQKPEWLSAEYDYAVIKDLLFPERYYDVEAEEYTPCAPAVAEFDSVMVTEIQITLKGADKYLTTNKFGEKDLSIAISEIAVLGGATK
ncbi:MAG: hypothetical protein E7461_03880 [Ruminococcaceae bacterium]|nr:hypothetical protein [Oscillospiraceae bacterium]